MFGTPLVIILTATGMYAYWLMRSWLFMHADEDEIVHTLEIDVWAMNNWKKVLRSFFLPLELR